MCSLRVSRLLQANQKAPFPYVTVLASIAFLGLSQRFRSFIENFQITPVDEVAVPLAARGLYEDAEVDHVSQRLRNRWSGDANSLRRRWDRNDWVSLHVLEDAQHRSGGSAERFDLLLIAVEKVQNLARRVGGPVSSVAHANQEEIKPSFPIALCSHPVEQFVVRGPIGFEIQTEIEDRLTQRTL